jgi:hypothetical protein
MSERKIDADTYARVFEHGEGKLILDDLTSRYCEKLFFPGGEEGRRRTDFALGANSVVDFIKLMIRQSKEIPPHDDQGQPAA